MAERGVTPTVRTDRAVFGVYLRAAAIGLLTGLLAGVGAFMESRSELLPEPFVAAHAVVLVGLAGVYTHLLVLQTQGELRESTAAALVAFVTGCAVNVTAWVAPLYVYQYPPQVRDLILPSLLQQSLPGTLLVLLFVFFGGYLGTVVAVEFAQP